MALVAVIAIGAGLLALSGPSSANHLVVTAVRGNAYGFFITATVPGGQSGTRGPTPTVTLAPDASNSPQTATMAQGSVIIGPATLFSFGTINVSTEGALGPNGFVTSTATVNQVNRTGNEVFTAAAASSTCTANEAGVTGSTTIGTAAAPGGVLQTDPGDADPENTIPDHPRTTVPIPLNPAPNTTFEGHVHVGNDTDNFRYVFNEQIVNPDGSLTVRAAHQYFLGPLVTGELIIGEVTCGVTTAAAPTTTSSTVLPTTTSSTVVLPTTTSSTVVLPTTTSSTVVLPTTTSSTVVLPTTTSSTVVLPTTTSSTVVLPTTTSTTTALPGTDIFALIRQIVCPILQQLAADPFIGPFIEPFLTAFGCTA